MADTDLAGVAEDLYALPPGDFRAARDERAARIRVSGNRDLARAVAALRRPVVSAWLVNLLAREASGQLGELLALGESLRQAQQQLDGDRLRELSARRRDLVAALTGEAKRLAERAGQPAGLQVEREVEGTLAAALADPDAAAAVSSGCLTRPLSYAGLGIGDAAGAVAVPQPRRPALRAGDGPAEGAAGPAPGAAGKAQGAAREALGAAGEPAGAAGETPGAPGTTPPRKPARRRRETAEERAARQAAEAADRQARQAAAAAERRASQIAAAQQAITDAADTAAAAEAALGEAEQQVTSARAAQEDVRGRIERLDAELSEAVAEQGRANRAARDAQQAKEAAARALAVARQRLARAETAARRLES